MMRKPRGGYIKNDHKEKHCMAFTLYCGHIMRKKEIKQSTRGKLAIASRHTASKKNLRLMILHETGNPVLSSTFHSL